MRTSGREERENYAKDAKEINNLKTGIFVIEHPKFGIPFAPFA